MSLEGVSDDGALIWFTLGNSDTDSGFYAWRLGAENLSQVHPGHSYTDVFFSEAGTRAWFGYPDPETGESETLFTWSDEGGGLLEIGEGHTGYRQQHVRGRKILFLKKDRERGAAGEIKATLLSWSVDKPQLVTLDYPVTTSLQPTPDGSRAYYHRYQESPGVTSLLDLPEREIIALDVEDETKMLVGEGFILGISEHGIVYQSGDRPGRSYLFWQDGESSLMGRW